MPPSTLMPSLLQRLAWVPLRLLFLLFGRLSIRGLEHVHALSGPAVFASNHVSEIDPLLLVAALPPTSPRLPLIFVSREKGFYSVNWRRVIYGGRFFRMMGAYPAQVGIQNYEKALATHLSMLRGGTSVSIFPMGGIRPRNGVPLKARGGVAYLAHATGCPVVPVRIEGAEEMRCRDFFTRRRHMRVTFGPPLYAQDFVENPHVTETENGFEDAAVLLMQKVVSLSSGSV